MAGDSAVTPPRRRPGLDGIRPRPASGRSPDRPPGVGWMAFAWIGPTFTASNASGHLDETQAVRIGDQYGGIGRGDSTPEESHLPEMNGIDVVEHDDRAGG